jgi:hypothetical protein
MDLKRLLCKRNLALLLFILVVLAIGSMSFIHALRTEGLTEPAVEHKKKEEKHTLDKTQEKEKKN